MEEYEDVSRDYGVKLNPMTGNDAVMRWWLDTEPSIQKFELILRGFRIDLKTGNWVYQDKQEWMNETGVNKAIGSVVNYLDPNLILSNIKEDRIEIETYYFKEKLIKMLAKQECEFGLDIGSYGSMIVKNCGNIIYFALRRANDFKTARALSSNTNIVEQNIQRFNPENSQQGEPHKRSFLSFLPFRRN